MNKKSTNKQYAAIVSILALVLGLNFLTGRSAKQVFAVPAETVDICHATGSDSNPYTQEHPAKSADVGGHDGHSEDIIPPFTYDCDQDEPCEYEGKNWTDEGEAIWSNDCETEEGPSGSTGSTGSTGASGATGASGPEETPTPTQTPSNPGGPGDGLSDGRSDGKSSCPECTQAPTGQVLGATTDYAATGVAEEMAMNVLGAMGGLSAFSGLAMIAKKRKNK